jgi:hypothetical protein
MWDLLKELREELRSEGVLQSSKRGASQLSGFPQ